MTTPFEEELAAAWQTAEDAIPEDRPWHICDVSHGDDDKWSAVIYRDDHRGNPIATGVGHYPSIALRNLAAAIKENQP
jgi:hypothetical protein